MKKYFIITILSAFLLSGCTLNFNSSSSGTNTSDTSDISNEESGTISTNSETTSDSDYREGYELYWEDDFDGSSLNTANWSYMLGNGSDYGIPGWGNNEAEWYKRENISLEDGKLVITAKKETVGSYNYTSGRLRTAGKVMTKYGRIEARIALPEIDGMWPAFWMMPEDNYYGGWPNSGEIDIMENRGREYDITSGALHFGSPHQYETKNKILRDSYIGDYHIYAIEWKQTEICWFVDDHNFFTVTSDKWFSSTANPVDNPYAPFDQDFHILLNLAVGGNFSGGVMPPNDFVSADMFVDYVRIYKPA
ncbi:MAG: glycoside hydrolase family 16 protein [Bacilli bacterium]|jgi:beta-glucanase (GH16 family)